MTTLTQLLATMPTPERPNAFVDMIELYLVYEDIDDLGNTRLAFTATDSSSAARLAEGLGYNGARGRIETKRQVLIVIDGKRFYVDALAHEAQLKLIADINVAKVAARLSLDERKLLRDTYRQETR